MLQALGASQMGFSMREVGNIDRHEDLSELLRASGPALFARALRLTRNRADAWDLLQDSLERMLTRCPDRTSTDAMQRWLSVIMRNLSTDRYRAAQRHRQVSLQEGILIAEPVAPAEEPAWASFEPLQVAVCVARLEPRLREAYRLRVEQRLSLAAAAQVLGVPVATVGTRVHRARRRLKVLLEAERTPSNVGRPRDQPAAMAVDEG